MRYFIKLAYHGASFIGWQSQPKGHSVQGAIQEALSTIFQRSTDIVGCGRTDAGVHASMFYAHFDMDQPLPQDAVFRLNKMLPPAIVVHDIFEVGGDIHARFNAVERTYQYHLTAKPDPFLSALQYHYYGFHQLDHALVQAAASLLLSYGAFYPFCKSRSDTKHYRCHISKSEWSISPEKMTYKVSANRFLRGMVRLIVGMCIQVGSGQLALEQVRKSLDHQHVLARRLSAPAHGLFLTDIVYDPPLQ